MARLCFLALVVLLISAVVALAGVPAASGAETLPQVKSVQVGFGNHYKLGCWTPVEVTLNGAVGNAAQTQRIDVQAIDGDGVPAWFSGPLMSAAAEQTATAYIRLGRANQPLQVRLAELDAAGQERQTTLLPVPSASAAPQAVPATSEYIVELGASIGLPETMQRLSQNGAEPTTVVTVDQPEQLPDQWYGYDGVDLVVIAGAPAVDKSLFSAAAISALEKWVQQGGKLLVCCGDRAEKVLGQDAPLALCAGRICRRRQFAGSALWTHRKFCRRRAALRSNFAAGLAMEKPACRLPRPTIRRNAGRGFASHYALAAGIRGNDFREHGFGSCAFYRVAQSREILGAAARPAHTARGTNGRSARYESREAVRVCRSERPVASALDQFAGVQLIPFWAVAILALAYIAVLFPLNYWVVNRWLRRQALAWVLFPAAAAAFSLGAYALANYEKGTARRVNQVDLVDTDLTSGAARGVSWFNVFNPKNALYNLSVLPADNQHRAADATADGRKTAQNNSTLLSWFGLPGTGLGGMNSAAANPPLFDEPYTINTAQGALDGVPLAAWSSKSFVARWEHSGGRLETALATTPDRRLRGTLISHLPTALEDCVLLFDRWAYPLGTLTPEKTVTIDRLEPQTIDTYFTKRRTINAHDEVPTYDRTSFDVPRIIEVMMFHEAAGGANYTGLLHRYQHFVDLTNQLQFGRAILVGRGAAGAVVQIDGQPVANDDANRHASVYRFVMEVKPTNSN